MKQVFEVVYRLPCRLWENGPSIGRLVKIETDNGMIYSNAKKIINGANIFKFESLLELDNKVTNSCWIIAN